MVLIATLPNGNMAAFAVEDRPTAEDMRRLAALQPMLADAVWTGRKGGEAR